MISKMSMNQQSRPDGKMLYYSEDVYPGGYFQYNKDPNSEIFVINSYNIETGETKE
jgi:hypothetical protein